MPKSAKPQKTINEKLAQLDNQLNWFYGDDFSLDQALDHYKDATKLADEIESDLAELKNKVELLGDFTKE